MNCDHEKALELVPQLACCVVAETAAGVVLHRQVDFWCPDCGAIQTEDEWVEPWQNTQGCDNSTESS